MATKKITESIQSESTKRTAAASKQVDPAKELKAKKAAETAKKVEAVLAQDILNPVVVEQYKALLETKAELEARIKELFDIEAAGLEFADVINAKTAYEEDVDMTLAAKQAIAEQKLADTEEMIKAIETQFNVDMAAKKAEINKERTREEEEYSYNKKRERQKTEDDFNDKLAAKQKEVDTKEADVKAREEAVAAAETETVKLQAKVNDIPRLVAEATEAGEKSGKDKATTGFNIEKGYLKRDYENQLTMKDNKIDMLSGQLADANDTIKALQDKLDAAYAKIQEVSLKTVEGVNADKVMDAVKKVTSTASGK